MMQQFDKYTTYEPCSYTVRASSHVPDYNIIDLDYPMYGTTVVKCGGRKYDLEVVKRALALVDAMKGRV